MIILFNKSRYSHLLELLTFFLYSLMTQCLTNVFFQQGDSMGRDPEHPKPSLLNALDWCQTGIWISWIRRHSLLRTVHCPSQAIASITSPIFFQSLLIWYRSVRLGCYWSMSAVYFSRPISLYLCSDKFRTIDFVIMVRYVPSTDKKFCCKAS